MATANKPTTIPRVPLQTPMFEDPQGSETWPWELTRAWIIFFERIWKGNSDNKTGAPGPFRRTLLLKDCTVGNDIADHTTIDVAGTALRLTGVLRKAITADLTVACMIAHPAGSFSELVRLTIPLATVVNKPLNTTSFTSIGAKQLAVDYVVRWDVIASDGSKDAGGVASFNLVWQ